MKLNNFLFVSIFLLAIITFGAVSAADDDSASITAVDDLDLAIQEVDEIDADGGVDSDVAVSEASQDNDKLGATEAD